MKEKKNVTSGFEVVIVNRPIHLDYVSHSKHPRGCNAITSYKQVS